jgi:hypothetical protein
MQAPLGHPGGVRRVAGGAADLSWRGWTAQARIGSPGILSGVVRSA